MIWRMARHQMAFRQRFLEIARDLIDDAYRDFTPNQNFA